MNYDNLKLAMVSLPCGADDCLADVLFMSVMSCSSLVSNAFMALLTYGNWFTLQWQLQLLTGTLGHPVERIWSLLAFIEEDLSQFRDNIMTMRKAHDERILIIIIRVILCLSELFRVQKLYDLGQMSCESLFLVTP